MTYYGVTQYFPGVIAIVLGLRVGARAIASGLLVGQLLAVVLYVFHVDIAGINIGLICLAVNVLVVFLANPSAGRKHVHADLIHSNDS
jgi:SSS family solute:Na+ symporter